MQSGHIERVPAFPARRLFALIDADADLHSVLRALEPHADPAAIRVLSGEQGVRALDISGAARGLRGRAMRALQDILYSRGDLHLHESHLRRGGHLLVIPARDWEGCQRLVAVLTDWRARGLVWFARFSVLDVTPRYCAASGLALAVR